MSCFLIWDEGRGVSRDQARGVRLRCFAHPSGGVECGVHAQYPTFFCSQHFVFASSSSEVAVGVFFFGVVVFSLLFRICPSHASSYF